jgi:hypothetical protein
MLSAATNTNAYFAREGDVTQQKRFLKHCHLGPLYKNRKSAINVKTHSFLIFDNREKQAWVAVLRKPFSYSIWKQKGSFRLYIKY